MRRILLTAGLLLTLSLTTAAQSGRHATAEANAPMLPEQLTDMSFTKTVTVTAGKDSRTFVYEMFVRDDYRAAATQPIAASVKLKTAYVRSLDNIVTADVRLTQFVPASVIPTGDVPLTGSTVFNPQTGLPECQELDSVVSDKNGRSVPVRVKVTFSNWRRRKVEVKVLDIGDLDEGADIP